MAVQTEFNFYNLSETELELARVKEELATVTKSLDKMRKKLFAEVGHLKKAWQLKEFLDEQKCCDHGDHFYLL